MLFLVKQALLWPGAAISSHLRFCQKGLFWEDVSFITREEDLPQGESEASCLLSFSQLSPYRISYILCLSGELSCHDCWYFCKRTMTKYIALCSSWLRDC